MTKKKDPADIKKAGRKTLYNETIALDICAKMAEGFTLRQICNDNPDYPCRSTIFRWQDAHPLFSDQYARALQMQAHYWVDEMIEIADDGTNDTMMRENKKGDEYETVDYDHIRRSELRVNTRKFLASKLLPHIYGDKITQEITGKDGKDLIPVLNITIEK